MVVYIFKAVFRKPHFHAYLALLQNLEDRQNGSHRDKAATVMEITLLKDQLQTKQHQLDMEMKVKRAEYQTHVLCVETSLSFSLSLSLCLSLSLSHSPFSFSLSLSSLFQHRVEVLVFVPLEEVSVSQRLIGPDSHWLGSDGICRISAILQHHWFKF